MKTFFPIAIALILAVASATAQAKTIEAEFARSSQVGQTIRPHSDEFLNINEFLRSTLKKGEELVLEAKGDLNNDRISDWAGIVKRPKAAFQSTIQLYVLVRQGPAGRYRMAATTGEQPHGGMGCCWVEDLQIKRSSIFIQNIVKSHSDIETAFHQFKLIDNKWRLIGLRIVYLDRRLDALKETDINMLTGTMIVKKQTGNKKPIVTRQKKTISEHVLENFDFENDFGIREDEGPNKSADM